MVGLAEGGDVVGALLMVVDAELEEVVELEKIGELEEVVGLEASA